MKLSGLPLLAFLSTASALDRISVELVAPDTIAPPEEGGCWTCQSDYDCQKPVCNFDKYGKGTCSAGTSISRDPAKRMLQTAATCPATQPAPTQCEVEILANLLDIAVSVDHKLAAQWLRLAFHDAGTFNKNGSAGGAGCDVSPNQGGANGCLMTDPDFRLQPENGFLDLPINTLQVIKIFFESHPDVCAKISSADIIQFAGLFASWRQVPPSGINSSKMDTLKKFQWGRPDEENCDTNWCDNLPGFQLGTNAKDIAMRCLNSGKEIKKKMIDRNGFTAEEACALIGAHTIGLTRNSFGVGHANPWVPNGSDGATKNGPVFDNTFHKFLKDDIKATSAKQFVQQLTPFDETFTDWYKDSKQSVNYLDTDVTLAFPSQDKNAHPDFHTFTEKFANNNQVFLTTFFAALDKMSKLGVDSTKLVRAATSSTSCAAQASLPTEALVTLISDLGTAEAEAEDKLRLKQESEILTNLRKESNIIISEQELKDFFGMD